VVDVLELRLRTRRLQDSLAALTRAQEKLRRSNKALSVFAGQVSHDLRTPLTAIMASTELLGQEDSVRADEWAVEGSGWSVWFELPAEGADAGPAGVPAEGTSAGAAGDPSGSPGPGDRQG